MNLHQTLACCLLSSLPMVAGAQESVGELLDQGGKRLSSQDVAAQIVGNWMRWKSPNGQVEFQARPNADGNLQGSVTRGFSSDLGGTWKMEDDGRFCMSASYKLGSQQTGFERCAYWFKSGERYWMSGSPGERGAKLFEYTVSK